MPAAFEADPGLAALAPPAFGPALAERAAVRKFSRMASPDRLTCAAEAELSLLLAPPVPACSSLSAVRLAEPTRSRSSSIAPL